jgi:ketosteroid isomerase-like protein
MKASKPEDLPGLFLEGLNSGDVDSVVALYEAEGIVAPDDARVVAGRTAIRAMVTGFLAQRPHLELHASEVVEAGDVALVRARVTDRAPGPLAGRKILVSARRGGGDE